MSGDLKTKGSALCNNWELEKGSEFKKLLLKFDFQKLNKILINQVRFFDSIIILGSTKMLAQIADLRLCALMSLRPYVFPRMSCALMSLRSYVVDRSITVEHDLFINSTIQF